MFSEKSVKHNSSYIYVAHCGHGDVRWEYRSLAERWNPLRYEIGIRTNRKGGPRWWINRHGKLRGKLVALMRRLRAIGREDQ